MARPSILSSQVKATSPSMKRSIRLAHACRSSNVVALSSDIMGWRWRTSANRGDEPAPTFWVGESGVRRSGNSSSSACSSRIRAS